MAGLVVPATHLATSPDRARQAASYRWIVFSLLAVGYIAVYFHRVSTAVVAPELIKAFHINAAALGLLSSMYFYPYAAMQIPAGILADTVGARKVITAALLLGGTGALFFGFAPTYGAALASRFVLSAGLACLYIPCLRILANWFRRQEMATAIGILFAVGNLGAIGAATPLALMVQGIGWRASFKWIGMVTLGIAALIYCFVRDHPADKHYSSPEAISRIAAPGPAPVPQLPLGQTVRQVIGTPTIYLFMSRGFFLYGACVAFQGLWGGPYLMQVFGLSEPAAGSLLLLISVGGIIGAPLSGLLSDKIFCSRKKVAVPAGVGAALCWLPLAFRTAELTVPQLKLILFAMGFCIGLANPAIAWVQESYPPAVAGTVVGVNNGAGILGVAFFQVLLGVVIGRAATAGGVYPVSGFHAAFQLCLLGAAAGAAAMFFVRDTQLHSAK